MARYRKLPPPTDPLRDLMAAYNLVGFAGARECGKLLGIQSHTIRMYITPGRNCPASTLELLRLKLLEKYGEIDN